MYKIRDLIDKEVFLVTGKKIGIVSSLLIDFNKKKVNTLLIKRFGLLKNKYISCSDIISIGNNIIVKCVSKACGIDMDNIIMKNVYSKDGILKGNVSDLLINEQSLDLEGIICYGGIMKKIKQGDTIIPINEVILGNKYILDTGNDHITLNSVMHKAKEEMLNDNSK